MFLCTLKHCEARCSSMLTSFTHVSRMQAFMLSETAPHSTVAITARTEISAAQKLQLRRRQERREEICGTMRAVERQVISGLQMAVPNSRDLESQFCRVRASKALAQGKTMQHGLWQRVVRPRCTI